MRLKRRASPTLRPGNLSVRVEDQTANQKSLDKKDSFARLEQENKQLKLELESMKRRLDLFDSETCHLTRKSSTQSFNPKWSPPPALPKLQNKSKKNSNQSTGLHYRRQPAIDEYPESIKIQKLFHVRKFRDSNDFSDMESPKPSYDDKFTSIEAHLNATEVGRTTKETKGILEEGMASGYRAMILDRAGWLVGLLVLQSMSSFIIQRNESMLQNHLVIVRFLTMLVGAGGNAGNQASVRVIRGLATGSIHANALRSFLWNEFSVGLSLSIILSIAGWIRAAAFATPMLETMAITVSLFLIVIVSVIFGATLPLAMKFLGIDPAHSSTSIQVLMDILGVTITVLVSSFIFSSSIVNTIQASVP